MLQQFAKVSEQFPNHLPLPSSKPFTADDLDKALMQSGVDNPTNMANASHWLSKLNGLWLKQMLAATEIQTNLFKPFGVPKEIFTQWTKPLVSLTEAQVSQNKNPDLAAQNNEMVEKAYADRLKLVVHFLTQPVEKLIQFTVNYDANDKLEDIKGFDKATCKWACENTFGQSWLLIQLACFRQLEYRYVSGGPTHLSALKQLLRSLLQVISGQVLSDESLQPYRKKNKQGEWRDTDADYLQACADRLINLLKFDAFNVRKFANESPYSTLGACEYTVVPGSEIHTITLRHYPRPKGVKPNGRTMYLSTPMINRCEIFDLAPGKSVIEGMLNLGYDLYMVDYGNPGPEQSKYDLGFYGKEVQDKYLELIIERHPDQLIDVMAYCMGGTIFLPYLARRIEEAQISGREVRIRQVVLLTTPVLFDDDKSGHKPMRDIIRETYNENVMKMFYGKSNVSPYAVGSGMNMIQPGVEENAPSGFYARASIPGAIQDAAPFLHWLFNGTRFPALAHRQWIKDIFMGNEIWKGNYPLPSVYEELDGKPVDMDAIAKADITLFDYCGSRDPIAPVGSCMASTKWGRTDKSNRQVEGEGMNYHVEKNIGHIFVVSQTLLADFLQTVEGFLNDVPPDYQKPAK